MYAAVLTAPNRLKIKKTPIPEPGVGEVRVQLEGCGVCGSNLAPWEGRPWFNYPFKAGAPGHEGWGVIEAVGPEVKTLSIGQRVALLSYRAFAEYDVAKQDSVVLLPQALNDKPFPGEALGCAMNVFRRCEIKAGQTVAVIGVGFMGALLTSLASRAGARVIAISRRPFALNIACQMGAREGIPMDDHAKIIEQVKTLTDGTFCDCVIEAVGAQWPLDIAGEITRERGRLVIAGYHQDGPRQVNMQLWNWRGLDVINAHERDPQVYVAGVKEAVSAVASNRLNPTPLYTHTFALDKISEAFDAMSSRPNNFLKALIQL
jgi:threonine dehydrogenase-like Zn-dependent dehydrogenase